MHTMADDIHAAQSPAVETTATAASSPSSTTDSGPFLSSNTSVGGEGNISVPQASTTSPAPAPAPTPTPQQGTVSVTEPNGRIHTSRSASRSRLWVGVIIGAMIALLALLFLLVFGGRILRTLVPIGEQPVIQEVAPTIKEPVESSDSPVTFSNTPYTYTQEQFLQFEPSHGSLMISQQATTIDVVNTLRSIVDTSESEMVVDVIADGEPMPFSVFAHRFLTVIPDDIVDAMNQPFQLYILPSDYGVRFGIHTYTEMSEALRNNLRTMETTLIKGFAPLYNFDIPPVVNAEFEDSDHRGVPIRFYNFTPDAAASIDYATHYDHVFFGTSRATMYRMMDRVFDYTSEAQRRVEEMSKKEDSSGQSGETEGVNTSSEDVNSVSVVSEKTMKESGEGDIEDDRPSGNQDTVILP